ncbi:hypothetical protein GCM10010082_17780 [Kushneria pakistanensis]|uniref:DarT domain-containing protein n=1 Tax=Kushneria pakistanensis TaxID=1508770 RepID=A0ABQ3FIE2_9GAMM|nr:DarT ssDNA thymidine ADP-ribosyltransferase family protein [Kushneria pakistanensis]GHC25355.1 hypothetical protein GCM10010082_17780 [Kushneria pakistanensis]
MREVIQKYGIQHVWHFTEKSNCRSIRENGGLCSLRELRQRGVTEFIPGGNEWSHDADRYKDVDQYIHLAFLDNHPMLYCIKREGRIKEPVWLQIDSSILFEENVFFTNKVSNANDAILLSSEEARQAIDFEVLFARTDWTDPDIKARRKAAMKSEILYPKFIHISKIKGWKDG